MECVTSGACLPCRQVKGAPILYTHSPHPALCRPTTHFPSHVLLAPPLPDPVLVPLTLLCRLEPFHLNILLSILLKLPAVSVPLAWSDLLCLDCWHRFAPAPAIHPAPAA